MSEAMEHLLTKGDVCEIFGVTESWLNGELQRETIPHLRLGKKKLIRFRRSHIETYLASRERVSPVPEPSHAVE